MSWRYDVANLLGPPGGFGRVYAGDGNGTEVAVKVVDLAGSPASRRDALLREVDIAQKLRATAPCNHLLPALDHAVVGDSLLIVMDRASDSLADLVGTLSEPDALVALRNIASGLSELHGAGVLHRHLKPGNVLFHDGVWKLADFGISRDVDTSTGTVTWAGSGTLRYMAPELFDPPWAVTVKSDLYADGMSCV
jgi:serine/threonine protein kinase